jgi:hypothetical protein
MARFKVLRSELLGTDDLKRTFLLGLDVEMRDGDLHVGDTFVVFDTHHPTQHVVVAVEGVGTVLRVECEVRGVPAAWLLEHAVIDTAGRTKGVHFFYEH